MISLIPKGGVVIVQCGELPSRNVYQRGVPGGSQRKERIVVEKDELVAGQRPALTFPNSLFKKSAPARIQLVSERNDSKVADF